VPNLLSDSNRPGFSIAALILSIISFCCCCISPLFSIPAALLAVHVFVRGYDGKVKAGISLFICVISLIIFAMLMATYVPIYNDFKTFVADEVAVEHYRESGELPKYIEKYDGREYNDILERFGYNGLRDYLDQWLAEIEANSNKKTDQTEPYTENHTESYTEKSTLQSVKLCISFL